MRLTPTLCAAIVVLSLVSLPVAADVVGDPELDVAFVDNTVTPDEDTTLELRVINSGDIEDGSGATPQEKDRVTTARGLTVTVRDGSAPINVNTGKQAVGTLPEGTASLAVPISVADDAEPGRYTVDVVVDYTYTRRIDNTGDETEQDVRRTIPVTLRVEEDADIEVVSVESEVRVGATETVNVTVRNAGTEAARQASLQMASENTDLSFSTSSQASRELGDLRPEQERTVAYEVTAARSARSQRYAMSLSAEYDDGDGVARTESVGTVGITPAPEQTFAVVNATSTVTVGDTGTVSVTMRNEGPLAVTDAEATLSSTSPVVTFAGSESATRFVGAWEPNETRTLEYDLAATDDAESRAYSLEATVAYRDDEGDAATAPTRSLGVTPGPERSFEITDTNTTLAVGSEGRLTGTVTNTGEGTFEGAAIVYTGSSETVTAIETEAPVGTLGPGESAQFSLPFEISSSAEAGPKQLPIAVQYRNEDRERIRTDSFDIRAEVGPDDPEFDLRIENATVAAGSGTQLRVTVTNDEPETLTAISAKLFAEDPLSTSDDEAFISELEPGETETIIFDVGASAGALSKTYPLSMDFQYDDSDGDTLTSDTYRLALQVTESEGGGGLPIVPILVLVVLVAGGVVYYLRRD